jgi:hypothetical protein
LLRYVENGTPPDGVLTSCPNCGNPYIFYDEIALVDETPYSMESAETMESAESEYFSG